MNLDQFIEAYKGMGIQGSVFANAVKTINKMITWTPDQQETDTEEGQEQPENPTDTDHFFKRRCKIYLGFSSFMGTSGTRDIIKYLCEHRMVEVLVTTAGALEEDLIKCFGDYISGSFDATLDKKLLDEGYERQGNIYIPKDLQQRFKEWLKLQLRAIHVWQEEQAGNRVTHTLIARRLGAAIENESSVFFQAARNDIPVFVPTLTDGFIGEVLYEYNKENPGLRIDVARDIVRMNQSPKLALKTGVIVLGGGVAKHHVMNANRHRGGADYTVRIGLSKLIY